MPASSHIFGNSTTFVERHAAYQKESGRLDVTKLQSQAVVDQ
jgi:hypothetical protein